MASELSRDFYEFLIEKNAPRTFSTDLRILKWCLRLKIEKNLDENRDDFSNSANFLRFVADLGMQGPRTDEFVEYLFHPDQSSLIGRACSHEWAAILL